MVATQQAFSETTKDGNYLITNLKPGTYNLAVEADGFKRSVQEGIRLATGERIRVATVLDPGVVSEQFRLHNNPPRSFSTPQHFKLVPSSQLEIARGILFVDQAIATQI